VTAFRELGARWELASGLTSRGILHRVSGRPDEAVTDLREAFRLCRELKERSIITWTANALAGACVDAGDLKTAREALEQAAAAVTPEGPGSLDWLTAAEVLILLAEGERDAALERANEMLRIAREQGPAKDVAARVWWNGRVFGPDAVGGEEEMERARKVLEETHWVQALHEPDLVGR
jgi:tetratricopeptide (TPR) repeat protein